MTKYLDETIKGRPVYILAPTWIDYWPTGCALRTTRRDGMNIYVDKDNPNARVTPPRVID